jgi:hypothetical protein
MAWSGARESTSASSPRYPPCRQGQPDRAAVIDDEFVAQRLGDITIGLGQRILAVAPHPPVLYICEK